MTWDELRAERNRRLAETDWVALSDSPNVSGEMIMYRQALRELPSRITDLNNFTWPELADPSTH